MMDVNADELLLHLLGREISLSVFAAISTWKTNFDRLFFLSSSLTRRRLQIESHPNFSFLLPSGGVE
jgi:hypothetical protein